LNELYIDSRYQRRGLGGVLVKWGIDEANRRGLPTYIEGTSKGYGLYVKHGMREVHRIETDLSQYGGEPGQRHYYSILFRDAPRKSVDGINI
jgi:GNAT superfamily N-acetyltransferase